MQLMNEIPDTFWSLFRSVNRDIYIEALLCINEEYEYNNYFLTKEVCIQILSDMNAKKRFELQREENDTDFDMLETPSSRILNWLLRAGWLKRIEDYNTLVTNIVIPDYAAVMIDAFEKLNSEDASETDIYIQNVYATLYAFRNDPRASIGLLRTALVNTRRLNKALRENKIKLNGKKQPLATRVQNGDVMVLPDERGVFSRHGAMYHAVDHFVRHYVGPGCAYAFAYGFPSERAFKLGFKLGLYAEAGRMMELRWVPLPAQRHRG